MKVLTQVVLVIWGLALLAGGIIGYAKAGSLPSLIAGGGFGIAMLVEAFLARRKPVPAFFGAGGLSLILIYFFGKNFYTSDWSDVRNGVLAGAAILVTVLSFVAASRSK